MSATAWRHDLLCLVADKDMEQAMLRLLERHHALGIRAIRSQIYVHPGHDPGCYLRSPEDLRPFVNQAAHALVLFDHEGSGREQHMTREALEADLETRLHEAGREERAAAIAIAPELEAWVWSDSPHVAKALGWEDNELRTWLELAGYLQDSQPKPTRPKEAVQAALRHVRRPRSSSIYGQLAASVSVDRCADPSFGKLKAVLTRWFEMAR
jgi:hypothetical protein